MKEELYRELALQFKDWVEAKEGRIGAIMLEDPDDVGFAANAMIDSFSFSKMLFSMMKENKELAMQMCGMVGLFANTQLTKKECEEAKQYVRQLTHDYMHGGDDDQPENENLN